MNPETGQVRVFATWEEATKSNFTVPVERMPDSSCRLCHGRGSVLINYGGKKGNKFKPCKCVR